MWRFLLPASIMMAAVIVLFAGAFGDLRSLPEISDRVISFIGGVESEHAPQPASVPAPSTEQGAVREAMQRQVTDLQKQVSSLQQQVAQQSHDLDAQTAASARARQDLTAARTEADKLRQDVDALHQQRKAEEGALARQRVPAQQPVPAPARPPVAAPAPAPPVAQAPPVPPPSASQQLLTARQWLATGRPDEARRVLATVQTQMVLRPVTPDQPQAAGSNQSASDVGNAIRWLDMGANHQAMLAINRAIDSAGAGEMPRPQWSGYPQGYSPTGTQPYYTDNAGR